ncbi:META domain-containing protein [Spirosoma taeanense]|uniref:META domain-containing protein n=1 Tax=Spirosoma taeanense TaxID=2735870 RepID=A0A6M5YDJ9_9BACT|nr:META domain-containing protein [Spirosoma taeanense]QJW92087.1 META domain-containing protein [Spirosoma taeanense]
MRNAILLASLLLLMAFQCSSDKEPVVAPGVAKLIGTWRLVDPSSSYDVTLQLVLDKENPPVDVTPFKASGRSSVNQYNALLFAAADGMILVSEVGSTKMAGPAEAMEFEQAYFTNLKNIVRYELTNDRLRIQYGGPKPGVLVYEKTN